MSTEKSAPKREKSPPPAPSGLSARTFEAGGEEFVLFSWGGEREPEGPPSEVRKKASDLPLGAAEREVLDLLVSGATNREIALKRQVSERTVANQVASILRKLGARSRFELIRRFAEE